MKRINDKIELLMRCGITVIFGILVLYLFLLAGFSTSMLDLDEHSYLVDDSMIINFIYLVGFIFFLILISLIFSKRYHKIEGNIKSKPAIKKQIKLRKLSLIIIGVEALFFILLIDVTPRADQMHICEVASQIIDKNYIAFEPGGYIDKCTNQSGIVFFLYLLFLIFGGFSYSVIKLLNVISLVWLFNTLATIFDFETRSERVGDYIVFFGMFFSPLILYANFVYGTIIGFAFIVSAIKYSSYYCEDCKIKNLAMSSVCMFLSLMVKSNYLICLIGMLIYSFFMLVKTNRLRIVILSIAILVILCFGTKFTQKMLCVVTGQELKGGLSSLAYIAMGIQESDMFYDGWFNGYNYDTYIRNEYETEKQAVECKAYITDRIEEFKNHKRMAVRFFSGKNASQWNSPDFGAFWINQKAIDDNPINYSMLSYNMFSAKGAVKIINIFNRIQFCVLFGVFIFVFLCKNKSDIAILFEIIVFGGFLFHTFWEAKGQYILTYFVLLIPLAVMGYKEMVILINKMILSNKKPKHLLMSLYRSYRREWVIIIALLAVITIIGIRKIGVLNDIFIRCEDTQIFNEYLEKNNFVSLTDGEYYVSPHSNLSSYLTGYLGEDNSAGGELGLTNSCDNNCLVKIKSYDYECSTDMLFLSNDGYLDIPGRILGENIVAQTWKAEEANAMRWRLLKSDLENEYYIINKNYALTYDAENGQIVIRTYERSENQLWHIISNK
ncbi:MAG: hypothetical protein K6G76_01560 [Lachnospiraceae bacterium]|nr:hypothetical protein [Lachnospiraceae bacterium]